MKNGTHDNEFVDNCMTGSYINELLLFFFFWMIIDSIKLEKHRMRNNIEYAI